MGKLLRIFSCAMLIAAVCAPAFAAQKPCSTTNSWVYNPAKNAKEWRPVYKVCGNTVTPFIKPSQETAVFNSRKFLSSAYPYSIPVSRVSGNASGNSVITAKNASVKINGSPDWRTDAVTGLYFKQPLGSLKAGTEFTMYQGKKTGDYERVTAYTFSVDSVKCRDCFSNITLTYIGRTDNITNRVFTAAKSANADN